ncbi:hypothetical protein [Halobaculum sp. D14]|uniref:hypothetical protein n=1 Tax=Halobaculum sp. D14 TaxID=3421642 RepID=UPI003EBE76D9
MTRGDDGDPAGGDQFADGDAPAATPRESTPPKSAAPDSEPTDRDADGTGGFFSDTGTGASGDAGAGVDTGGPRTDDPFSDVPGAAGGDSADGDAAHDPVDALLYGGETRRASLLLDGGTLVATSHRLLAYTPGGDDAPNLRALHRANVTDVSLSAAGRGWLLRPATYALLCGLILVGFGSVVSLDSMASTSTAASGASSTGVGGLASAASGVVGLLALLDDALRVAGAACLLVAAALLALYLRSRTTEVVVGRAGDDPLRLPAPDPTAEDVRRVERAATEPAAAAGDGEPARTDGG